MADGNDAQWLEQEAFLRDASDPAGRLLALTLSRPPRDPVPEDFAVHVAMLATRQPQAEDGRLEMLLLYGLLGLLSVSGLAMAQRVLADWWETPDLTDPGGAQVGWLAALLLCLALSAAPGFLGSRLR